MIDDTYATTRIGLGLIPRACHGTRGGPGSWTCRRAGKTGSMECFLSADAVSYFVGSLRSAPPYLTGGLSFALEKEVPRLHGMEPGMEPENLCEALGGAQSTSPGSRYYLT